MNDAAIWDIEEGFWCEGVEFYESHLAQDAIMVFPRPVGTLEGQEILAAVEGSTRWEGVLMADRLLRTVGETRVLVYRATGTRDGVDPYTALCSSTYIRRNNAWSLLAHHQQPVG